MTAPARVWINRALRLQQISLLTQEIFQRGQTDPLQLGLDAHHLATRSAES